MAEVMTRKARTGMNLPVRTSLVAWWRFHVALTNVNGACSQWQDQSGNGNHLNQTTAALRPTINSDGSVQFNGTSQYMQATFTLNQPCSIYLAFRQVSYTSGNIIFDGVSANGRLAQSSTANSVAANAGSALSDSTTLPVGTAFGVAGVVFNNTASVMQLGGGAASTTTTGTAGANNLGGITLGASRVPGNYAPIVVKEMAVFNVAHDAQTRLWILRYMQRIAGIGGV